MVVVRFDIFGVIFIKVYIGIIDQVGGSQEVENYYWFEDIQFKLFGYVVYVDGYIIVYYLCYCYCQGF